YLRFVLITTKNMIDEKPDLLQRYMRAYSRALRYTVDHPAETIAAAAKQLGLPEDDEGLAKSYQTQIEERLINPDLRITPEQVKFMQMVRTTMGAENAEAPLDQVLDLQFQQRVEEELGAWEW